MTAPTSTGIKPAPAGEASRTLTDQQLATWAKSAGFTGEDAVDAVAIALAESSGRYAVVSAPNFDGSRDYGAWQINSIHKDLFQQYPDWWTASNAKMAKALRDRRGNFQDWTVFKTGAYLLFTARARKALADAPDGGVIEAGEPGSGYNTSYSLTAPLTDISNVFRAGFQPLVAAREWIGNPDNWLRVAQVVLGAALVVGGITIVARPVTSALAGPVASVVSKGKV